MPEATVPNEGEVGVKPRAEISVSTKGVVTWSVKAYGETAEEAVERAQAMHAAMIAKYGLPGGTA
jgi:hypothetical protein